MQPGVCVTWTGSLWKNYSVQVQVRQRILLQHSANQWKQCHRWPGHCMWNRWKEVWKKKISQGQTDVWSLGVSGIERDSKKCFFTTVENRTTLVNIIKQHFKPASTIISDCWKAYNSLDKEGFTHLTVNHSVNFVDPNSVAQTNTWRALKKSLTSNGTQKTLYDSYFSQYCIRKLYLNDSTVTSATQRVALVDLPKKSKQQSWRLANLR